MEFNEILYGFIQLIFAALIAFITAPIASVIAHKTRAIDAHIDDRRMHKTPTPLLGGLAIFFGFVITTIIFCDVTPTLIAIWFGGLIIVVTGVLDDIFDLNPLIKLGMEVIVAFIAISQDIIIDYINIFGFNINFGTFAIPITVLWIVALTNAINLIDGLDGLACGVSVIYSVSLLLISLMNAPDSSATILIAILAGSCLGFLPFNSNPAKIFMGDTGSLFLGYTLSLLSIQGLFKMHAVFSVIVPLIIFALPLCDTTWAFFRRLFNRKNPFKADRGHIHHRLIDMGFTHKQSVWILYAICGLLGITSIMFTKEALVKAGISIVFCIIIFVANLRIIKNPKTRWQAGLSLDLPEDLKADENAVFEQQDKPEKADEKEIK